MRSLKIGADQLCYPQSDRNVTVMTARVHDSIFGGHKTFIGWVMIGPSLADREGINIHS